MSALHMTELLLAAGLPNLDAPPNAGTAGPQLQNFLNMAVSLVKWLCLGTAGLCGLVAMGKIAFGRTNRSQTGVDGIIGGAWALGSIAGVATFGFVVTSFMQAAG